MNTNRHRETRKFLNGWQDYTDKWKAKYCQIFYNGNKIVGEPDCKKKFEITLKQSVLAKEFLATDSFADKVKLFKENYNDLAEFTYQDIYYTDGDNQYLIALEPKADNANEIELYNEYITGIAAIQREKPSYRKGFKNLYKLPIRTLAELKDGVEISIKKTPILEKKVLKAEIKRVRKLFKKVDTDMKERSPFKHGRKTIHFPIDTPQKKEELDFAFPKAKLIDGKHLDKFEGFENRLMKDGTIKDQKWSNTKISLVAFAVIIWAMGMVKQRDGFKKINFKTWLKFLEERYQIQLNDMAKPSKYKHPKRLGKNYDRLKHYFPLWLIDSLPNSPKFP